MKAKSVYEKLSAGEFDVLLQARYGEGTSAQKERYLKDIYFYSRTYDWGRDIKVMAVPYSILLAGDGTDVAYATDNDAILIFSENNVNITRFRSRGYTGEDNIDLYQHGPYTEEVGRTTAIVRGVQQAFLHFKYNVYGADMYADGNTFPEGGLDEDAHLAILLAYAYNQMFNDGRLTDKQLAEVVQWALANYPMTDSYATDVYSSLSGNAITGDFTNADAEKIKPIKLKMARKQLYLVNTGDVKPYIEDEDTLDERCDALLEKVLETLGKESFDEMGEDEFYECVYQMKKDKQDVDLQAVMQIADYYSNENFGEIYEKNAKEGMGSPAVETTLTFLKDSVGGALKKWYNRIFPEYWLAPVCVAGSAKPKFTKCMKKLFGKECLTELNPAERPAQIMFK